MKQVVFALIGVLAVIIAAAPLESARSAGSATDDQRQTLLDQILRAVIDRVTIDGARAEDHTRNPDIPDAIHRLVRNIEGTIGLDLIKSPGEISTSTFVARVIFEPIRPGYKACPDHYPSHFVRRAASCPSLRNDDPPASGWTNCHGAFYAPARIGCPPRPQTPTAPATTPRPRCDFGPETCKTETPGGPVLFRTLPGRAISGRTPLARIDIQPRILLRPEISRSARVILRTQPAASRVVTERARIPQAVRVARQPRLQLREQFTLRPNLLCRNGKCRWGGNNAPITLPAPPVIPFKHVPCEYEHISFFVSENRYCPKEGLGEWPAAGASVYVSWEAGNSSSPELYYHRNDFDGLSMVLRMILGGSDDRYAISEATEREKAAAQATAMLIKTAYVTAAGPGTVKFDNDPSWRPLCNNERFFGLPQPGRCSGVKIGDRLVATSAHCVRNRRQCSETSVVFGYYGDSATAAPRNVASEKVYQCMTVVASRRPASIGARGADWTIFEVDRDIDAPSAILSSSTDVRPSIVTTVIGHPMGLPAVVTRLGVVQTTTTEYFIVNSDTFVGNSGSAVFSAQSVEDNAPRVLGLLTGGKYDFEDSAESDEECVQAKWCNGPECLGDDVVYTDDLIAALSAYASEP